MTRRRPSQATHPESSMDAKLSALAAVLQADISETEGCRFVWSTVVKNMATNGLSAESEGMACRVIELMRESLSEAGKKSEKDGKVAVEVWTTDLEATMEMLVWVTRDCKDKEDAAEVVRELFRDVEFMGQLVYSDAYSRPVLKDHARVISANLGVSWWSLIDVSIFDFSGLDLTLQFLSFHASIEPDINDNLRYQILSKLKNLTETNNFSTFWNDEHYQSLLQFIFFYSKDNSEFNAFGGNKVRSVAKKPEKSLSHFMAYTREPEDDSTYLGYISADQFKATNWLWSLPRLHTKIAQYSCNPEISYFFLNLAIELSAYHGKDSRLLGEIRELSKKLPAESRKITESHLAAKIRLINDA